MSSRDARDRQAVIVERCADCPADADHVSVRGQWCRRHRPDHVAAWDAAIERAARSVTISTPSALAAYDWEVER